ncbi:YqaE/Pmp3 family membrane protein [Bacillus pacificus]
MMCLLAILLPPVAVLFCGKPFQAIINFILTLIFWVPGVIHAILVVHDKKADRRLKNKFKAYVEINKKNRKIAEL